MVRLSDKIQDTLPYPFFFARDVLNLVTGSPDRRYGLMKRAIATGEIVPIRRGLYTLAQRPSRAAVNPLALAQHVYGPSYISLETALRYHDLIPEGVFAVTSVSLKKSTRFETPLGLYTYNRVPQEIFYTQVEHRVSPEETGILLASPLKALADYIYTYKKDWTGLKPIQESLRVEVDALTDVTHTQIDELLHNYRSQRVRRFLMGLKKDLRL